MLSYSIATYVPHSFCQRIKRNRYTVFIRHYTFIAFNDQNYDSRCLPSVFPTVVPQSVTEENYTGIIFQSFNCLKAHNIIAPPFFIRLVSCSDWTSNFTRRPSGQYIVTICDELFFHRYQCLSSLLLKHSWHGVNRIKTAVGAVLNAFHATVVVFRCFWNWRLSTSLEPYDIKPLLTVASKYIWEYQYSCNSVAFTLITQLFFEFWQD